jgi:hypothetical protein
MVCNGAASDSNAGAVRTSALKGVMNMATTLNRGGNTPDLRKGHGTAALGPSDTSDSGSDIQGGPGLNRDDGLLQPAGTTSDPDIDSGSTTAGPDIGDADLDSDTDSGGTGERAAAGRDSTLPVDMILRDEQDRVIDAGKLGGTMESGETPAGEVAGDGVIADPPEPHEHGHARAQRKQASARDDVPVFDRGSRDDTPGQPRLFKK